MSDHVFEEMCVHKIVSCSVLCSRRCCIFQNQKTAQGSWYKERGIISLFLPGRKNSFAVMTEVRLDTIALAEEAPPLEPPEPAPDPPPNNEFTTWLKEPRR